MRTNLARRAGVLACAMVVAGLCGCLVMRNHCGPDCIAADRPIGCGPGTACADDRPLTDLGGFGMRPATVLKRTGFKVEELPYLKHFQAKVGVALGEVETFAVICFDAEKRAMLVRSPRDLNQGNVMMACEAGDLMPKVSACAAKVYTGKSGLAVHFPSPRVALITDSPATMTNCLKQLPTLTALLDKAGEADVSVWGRAVTMKKPEASTSYRMRGLLTRPGVHIAAKAAPPATEPAESRLDFLDVPMPPNTKVVWATINLGASADVAFAIDFADEASAKAGEEYVSDLLDLGRGKLISFNAQMRLSRTELEGPFKVVTKAGIDLLTRVGRAMNDVKVECKGQRVTASLQVALKPADRAAATLLFAEIDPKVVCGDEAWAGLFFEAKDGTAPGVPLVPIAPDPPPAIMAIISPPGFNPNAILPSPPPTTWTLTVANVLKGETALLFTVDAKGDLTFVAKVPPGEAMDFAADNGQKWAATFMSEPHRAMHTVSADKQVFLIRPAVVVPPSATPPY